MTLQWSTAVLLAVVGAVAREVGLGLLAVADACDSPQSRRAELLCAVTEGLRVLAQSPERAA